MDSGGGDGGDDDDGDDDDAKIGIVIRMSDKQKTSAY